MDATLTQAIQATHESSAESLQAEKARQAQIYLGTQGRNREQIIVKEETDNVVKHIGESCLSFHSKGRTNSIKKQPEELIDISSQNEDENAQVKVWSTKTESSSTFHSSGRKPRKHVERNWGTSPSQDTSESFKSFVNDTVETWAAHDSPSAHSYHSKGKRQIATEPEVTTEVTNSKNRDGQIYAEKGESHMIFHYRPRISHQTESPVQKSLSVATEKPAPAEKLVSFQSEDGRIYQFSDSYVSFHNRSSRRAPQQFEIVEEEDSVEQAEADLEKWGHSTESMVTYHSRGGKRVTGLKIPNQTEEVEVLVSNELPNVWTTVTDSSMSYHSKGKRAKIVKKQPEHAEPVAKKETRVYSQITDSSMQFHRRPVGEILKYVLPEPKLEQIVAVPSKPKPTSDKWSYQKDGYAEFHNLGPRKANIVQIVEPEIIEIPSEPAKVWSNASESVLEYHSRGVQRRPHERKWEISNDEEIEVVHEDDSVKKWAETEGSAVQFHSQGRVKKVKKVENENVQEDAHNSKKANGRVFSRISESEGSFHFRPKGQEYIFIEPKKEIPAKKEEPIRPVPTENVWSYQKDGYAEFHNKGPRRKPAQSIEIVEDEQIVEQEQIEQPVESQPEEAQDGKVWCNQTESVVELHSRGVKRHPHERNWTLNEQSEAEQAESRNDQIQIWHEGSGSALQYHSKGRVVRRSQHVVKNTRPEPTRPKRSGRVISRIQDSCVQYHFIPEGQTYRVRFDPTKIQQFFLTDILSSAIDEAKLTHRLFKLLSNNFEYSSKEVTEAIIECFEKTMSKLNNVDNQMINLFTVMHHFTSLVDRNLVGGNSSQVLEFFTMNLISLLNKLQEMICHNIVQENIADIVECCMYSQQSNECQDAFTRLVQRSILMEHGIGPLLWGKIIEATDTTLLNQLICEPFLHDMQQVLVACNNVAMLNIIAQFHLDNFTLALQTIANYTIILSVSNKIKPVIPKLGVEYVYFLLTSALSSGIIKTQETSVQINQYAKIHQIKQAYAKKDIPSVSIPFAFWIDYE